METAEPTKLIETHRSIQLFPLRIRHNSLS